MGFALAVFLGLCSSLHTLDQGLVCSSKCNIETMREVLFLCYYILLPSEKGLMLLRVSNLFNFLFSVALTSCKVSWNCCLLQVYITTLTLLDHSFWFSLYLFRDVSQEKPFTPCVSRLNLRLICEGEREEY